MQAFIKAWYQTPSWTLVFLPFAWIFQIIALLRRRRLQRIANKNRVSVPVIVIGNLTVGGTGKTPLLIALTQYLQLHGFHPGIVSRGYGARASVFPKVVRGDDNPVECGDEPVCIAKATQAPLVIDPKRLNAIHTLLSIAPCDVILSDDGLQHYAMPRDIEVVVVDSTRQFGNGHCLPAGPLREPLSRLKTVDFIVVNGNSIPKLLADFNTVYPMQLVAEPLQNVLNPTESLALSTLKGKTVHAVAGIGHPERFFQQLQALGCHVIAHPFPDHHGFQAADFNWEDNAPTIVMTEKDAIKCHSFAKPNWWYLPVKAVVANDFCQTLAERVEYVKANRKLSQT